MKLERIVKRYYDELENGKMMGRKCKRCGAVEFPPVLACNSCSFPEMEWIEISGKAKMSDFVLPLAASVTAENKIFMPYCLAYVELEEGSEFDVIVRGVSKENEAVIRAKLPVPVKAAIVQKDGYKTVVFDLIAK